MTAKGTASVLFQLFLFCLTVCNAWSPTLANAQSYAPITGRVLDEQQHSIAAASVIVTVAGTAESFQTVSDSSGRFAVAVPASVSEYLLYASFQGFEPERRRVVRSEESVTITLKARVASLPIVNVRARLSRPNRSLASGPPVGTAGNDRSVDGIVGALDPEARATVSGQALLVPGVNVGPEGISALGADPSQNRTILNGATFAGDVLPQTVRSSTRLTTSAWDPAIGGFSGVLTSVNVSRGTNIIERNARTNTDFISLNSVGAPAPFLNTIGLDFGGAGPLVLDSRFYAYGIRFSHSGTSLGGVPYATDMFESKPSADSLDRLAAVLKDLGVPVVTSLRGGGNSSATAVARFDFVPPSVGDTARPKSAWTFTGVGNLDWSERVGMGPSTFGPITSNASTKRFLLQMLNSHYFDRRGSVLSETSGAVGADVWDESPESDLPNGRVRLGSSGGDSVLELSPVTFGGNGSGAVREHSVRLEITNQTSFFVRGNETLPVKVQFESRVEKTSGIDALHERGTFEFPSIEAVSANKPSAFYRELGPRPFEFLRARNSVSLTSEVFRPKFWIVSGLRVDAQSADGGAREYSTVESGVVTSSHMFDLSISPRVGANWYYKGRSGINSSGTRLSVINQAGPHVRAGMGLFVGEARRANLRAVGISSAGTNATAIQCVGVAAPRPAWSDYGRDSSTVPKSCFQRSEFGGSQVHSTVFDQGYSPPRSLRSSLGWTGHMLGNYLSIDLTQSWNFRQNSVEDTNLRLNPAFNLRAEAFRPVFVSPTAIDPFTGLVSSILARPDTERSSVRAIGSKFRGFGRTLTLYAVPTLPQTLGVSTFGYSFASSSIATNGFDNTTGGDPRHVERGADRYTSTHTIFFQGAKQFTKFGVTAFVRARSGLPYTPLVGSDINGDGLKNDRAFIFDVKEPGDATLGSGLQALMQRSPRETACLLRQIGTIAKQNSCRGPWAFANALSVFFYSPLPRTADRALVSFSVVNPIGGLDRLMHGSRALRGWGTTSTPDPILLTVRSFDRAADAFQYDVNPTFGHSLTLIQNTFKLAVEVHIDMAPSFRAQRLVLEMREQPARVATRAAVDVLKKRLERRNFTDLYGVMIANADSFALSREQVEFMEIRRARLLKVRDSLFLPLAERLVALPPSYDVNSALSDIERTAAAGWNAIYAEKPFLNAILSSGQKRLLFPDIYAMLTVDGFSRRFYFGGY